MPPKQKPDFLDSARNRSKVRIFFYLSLVLLLAIDPFIPKHGHFAWEEVPCFFAAYGFIGCVSLIFVAKGLRALVKKREDYYD
jgi:hypothetical protein